MKYYEIFWYAREVKSLLERKINIKVVDYVKDKQICHQNHDVQSTPLVQSIRFM